MAKMVNHTCAGAHDLLRDIRVVCLQHGNQGHRQEIQRLARSDGSRNESVRSGLRIRSNYFWAHVGALRTKKTPLPWPVRLCNLSDSSRSGPEPADYFHLSFPWGCIRKCTARYCEVSLIWPPLITDLHETRCRVS